MKLRQTGDEIVKRIPVIFFSAYDWERLVEFTRSARETQPEPEISNSINGLLEKAVKRIIMERSKPIVYKDLKIPTRVEGGTYRDRE